MSAVDVYEIHSRLCRALSENGKVKILSHDFSELTSNSARVSFAATLLGQYNLFVNRVQCKKNNDVAAKFRENGNELFKFKKDWDAHITYTRSVAYSENRSEHLGLAFANRSAVLFQRAFYKECLIDINLALLNNYPQKLLRKLLIRKEKCEKLLKLQENLPYHSTVPSIKESNQQVACASQCVSVKYNESYGRHVVAIKDIEAGEVLAVEEPYAKILLKEYFYNHCHNCLKLCLNLIPCKYCTIAMFCSESCKTLAWDSYHKYECPILETLLNLDVSKLTLVALRISIIAKKEYQFIKSFGNNFDSNENEIYKSDRYREIHSLVSNAEKRSVSDLFERAVIAAIICNLMEKHTTFFESFRATEVDENIAVEVFQEVLLLHMQTAPSNFHEISELVVRKGSSEAVEIGCAVYSFLSLINHACRPNVLRVCYGSKNVLRSLMPIAKGEQIFDNYGYHHSLMIRDERRNHLLKQYYFTCECDACQGNWPLYQDLPSKGIDIGVSEEEVSALQNADMETAKTVMEKLVKKMKMLKSFQPCKELDDAQEILKQCMKIFGNKNYCT